MEKKKKSSLLKKFTIETDDLGLGSYLVPKIQDFRLRVKERLCPLEGIVYY